MMQLIGGLNLVRSLFSPKRSRSLLLPLFHPCKEVNSTVKSNRTHTCCNKKQTYLTSEEPLLMCIFNLSCTRAHSSPVSFGRRSKILPNRLQKYRQKSATSARCPACVFCTGRSGKKSLPTGRTRGRGGSGETKNRQTSQSRDT